MGLAAKEIMDRGDLVSDEIVNGIVSERLDQRRLQAGLRARRLPADHSAGRSAGQMLDEKGMELDAVVEITADPDVLVGRIAKRAKEIAGTARGDDNEEVLRNRLNVYREQTAPLVEYYRGKGLLKTVDGMQPVDDVTAAIRRRAA